MRISDWSSDVCSSDLVIEFGVAHLTQQLLRVSGANEPLVDQRDAVGMACDASDRGDRPVKMGLDPPDQGTFPDIHLVTPARDRSHRHRRQIGPGPPPRLTGLGPPWGKSPPPPPTPP